MVFLTLVHVPSAEGRDGRAADNDDEGEHDGALDGGRAVLAPEEPDNVSKAFGRGWLPGKQRKPREDPAGRMHALDASGSRGESHVGWRSSTAADR
jgi:hypothetical protein